jgi:hypothetical protein
MARLVFTKHAQDRMAQRGLTEAMVEHAVDHQVRPPIPGARPDTIALEGTLPAGGGSIKVVVSAADHDLVISVWHVEG